MIEFHEIGLDDLERLRPMLLAAPDRGCEYTFGNLYIWKDVYKTSVAYLEDTAVMRFGAANPGYLYPVGPQDRQAVREIFSLDPSARIIAARREDCAAAEEALAGRTASALMENAGEYVYSSEKLRELPGKKYHKKRNHISIFERSYPGWEFCRIIPETLPAVAEMNDAWCREYGCGKFPGLREESCAVRAALSNFQQLKLDGGFIRVDGRIVAFSIGEAINSSSYCVHIEKAFHEVNGAYTMINREFARAFCQGFQFINREDDAGEEGLRKAKLSYYPEFVSEKYVITLR